MVECRSPIFIRTMPRHFSTPFIFIYVFISLKKFFQNKNSKGIVSGVDKFDNFFCHLLHLKGIEYDISDLDSLSTCQILGIKSLHIVINTMFITCYVHIFITPER